MIRKKWIIVLVLLGIMGQGCAGMIEKGYALKPKANKCQLNEVRMSWLSNVTSVVCWDEHKRPINVAMVPGTSKAQVAVGLTQAAAIPGAAGIIAGAVPKSFSVDAPQH